VDVGLLEGVVRQRAGLVHHLAGVADDEQGADGFALLALLAEPMATSSTSRMTAGSARLLTNRS